MSDSPQATLAGVRGPGDLRAGGSRWRSRGDAGLLAVVGAFTLAQLLLVRPGMGLGWDESVYVSQVSSHAPAAFFSAPRARGVPLLVAPVAAWSSSTALLRTYLAVLSGLGLLLALRAWRGVFPARVLTTAGALFAGLWVTLFYGPQAMPNHWVAVGALAATGYFLRARTARALWGLALSAALMALMRPTDALWAALPLLVLLVGVRRWRRPAPLLALAGGLALGAAPWVIEAYVSYGGPARRLSDASRVQGGLGWNIAVMDQVRGLSGRTLCRPCTGDPPPVVVTLWWWALPLLAVGAAVVALRARRTAPTLVPLACAASAAFPYLFLIGYAAPRFLLPAYALLAVPVADLLVHRARSPGRIRRRPAPALLTLALAVHLAVQFAVLEHTVRRTTAAHREWARTAAALHRLGVRPPCLVTGRDYVPIAFHAGCASAAVRGHDANTGAAGLAATARRLPVAALVRPGGAPPAYARSWTPARAGALDVYLAPGVSAPGSRTSSPAP
ncbi:hypothetical protein [Streptomyces sp. NBC_00582]|uniref:hypothetical protein n=1 Tax=Streptomyces sp. NBC_00582 TaxID=2975783 RepID=UPI002E80D5CC|nr:hypothetical protein [Streptomyces sp. NBC_00582]WUB66361.1 hypothetical protein OG852_41065 [Streptomyces sp. NBC_00582]